MRSENIVSHEHFMRRALELAMNGAGNVSPNPLVGCVVTHDGHIVAEGWHNQYGGPHAEVNAIDNVADKTILKDCTVYVNLEPCSHTGKTPPCADMLIRHGVRSVIIANEDPNPLVSGNGIKKLQAAGITIQSGVLSAEGFELNKRFFTYMKERRPHIILKWAETADGFIARSNHDSKWISDDYSRQLVHKWRTEEDAVLVASGTAWHDNPMLNVRLWTGRQPLRVVIDRYLKLGRDRHLFDGKQRTICYNLRKTEQQDNLWYVRLPEEHMLESMLSDLYARKIQSVIVEGGAQLLQSFINATLWDEARIFISPKTFGSGIRGPRLDGTLKSDQRLATDWLRVVERKAADR